ncbi:hypothetical protein PAMP_020509 [Pampus punctatissimus]
MKKPEEEGLGGDDGGGGVTWQQNIEITKLSCEAYRHASLQTPSVTLLRPIVTAGKESEVEEEGGRLTGGISEGLVGGGGDTERYWPAHCTPLTKHHHNIKA